MGRLFARRLFQAGVVAVLVATFTFFLMRLAPGDPLSALTENPQLSAEYRANLRARYGLDRPLIQQYGSWMAGLATGDLGFSISRRQPVSSVLASAIPRTLLLMAAALGATFVGGVILGLVQASRPGSRTDRAISAASLFFYSLPDFWLALVVLYVFTVKIPAFPSGVNINAPALSWSARAWDTALHMVLPVATLALLTVALVARFQRSAVLEVSHNDYVRTARAKGAGEKRVMLRHVLRNALLPLITLLGLALPALFGGAVFIERIFSWPGIGNLTVGAIASRDYQLVSAIVLVAAVLVSLGNLLADMLYAAVDPRIRTAS